MVSRRWLHHRGAILRASALSLSMTIPTSQTPLFVASPSSNTPLASFNYKILFGCSKSNRCFELIAYTVTASHRRSHLPILKSFLLRSCSTSNLTIISFVHLDVPVTLFWDPIINISCNLGHLNLFSLVIPHLIKATSVWTPLGSYISLRMFSSMSNISHLNISRLLLTLIILHFPHLFP